MQLIHYTTLPVIYGEEQSLIRSDCNSLTIENTGTSTVIVDNAQILLPGDQYEIPGNVGEITDQQFAVRYTGAGINQITVTRKTYS